jgi:hypothetical protein
MILHLTDVEQGVYVQVQQHQSRGILVAWTANVIALTVVIVGLVWLSVALLWRVGSWSVHPAETLISDYGLQIGAEAPEIACHWRSSERHLSFVGSMSFVVFGRLDCEPCQRLLRIASTHPATRSMRLVYVGDSEEMELEPELHERWEAYRFHNEHRSRVQWRSPVSPYFHVIDHAGRVAAKGVASEPSHLDRLMSVTPVGAASRTLGLLRTKESK